MDRLQAMEAFVRVVEAGSFAGAAARLEVSVSAISRHVSDLETHLGARLLNRTTRRLSLTESGRAFHERCLQLLADLAEAEEEVGEQTAVPRGTLRLTCPIAFGVRHLAPAIAEFISRYPQLRFDIELSDRMVDLVDEGLDLAVRIGETRSHALIARRIGRVEMVCCASPNYLAQNGTPMLPADLAQHACLTYEYATGRNVWRFGTGEEGVEVRVGGAAHANNGEMLAALAAAGAGICLEPDFIVAPLVRSGALVRVLSAFGAAPVDVYAAYMSRRHLSAKVRSFIDFLVERFERSPEWRLTAPVMRPSTRRARRS